MHKNSLNTAARDRRGALQSLKIKGSTQGIAIVNQLKATEDAASVTDCRRERKAPVSAATMNDMFERLRSKGVEFTSRERGLQEGRTNATLTFYGNSATFYNHQETTKIRMRVRYYVDYARDAEGVISDVKRSKKTATEGFLELKVKTP